MYKEKWNENSKYHNNLHSCDLNYNTFMNIMFHWTSWRVNCTVQIERYAVQP